MTEGALARHHWLGDGGSGPSPDRAGTPWGEPAGSGGQKPLLLVVDDEQPVLQMLERLGERLGYDVVTCDGGHAALRAMQERPADLALVDLRMPDVSGMDVLRQVRSEAPSCAVVIMTAYGAIDSAVEAMKLGAREYITKPFDFPQLRQLLTDVREEIAHRHLTAAAGPARPGTAVDLRDILGDTPIMTEVSDLVRSLAPSARVVLLTGERGTGKELVARALHEGSPRRERPFVTINCSALVDTWFDRELFGHEKGAFSGADEAKPGLFEAAHGGTVFLDDVAELPLSVQATLQQTLDSGEIRRVGAQRGRPFDVAIVAATQRDLRADVAAGRFRADLYYRLSVVGIVLPPLRERRDDIPMLATAFLHECAAGRGKLLTGFSEPAMAVLREGRWAGNVRELHACVERACANAGDAVVTLEDVLASLQEDAPSPAVRAGGLHVVRCGSARQPLEDVEKQHILSVLRDVRGNRVAAARVLGISRRALYRRLARHQIGAETLHAVPARRREGNPDYE